MDLLSERVRLMKIQSQLLARSELSQLFKEASDIQVQLTHRPTSILRPLTRMRTIHRWNQRRQGLPNIRSIGLTDT